MYIFGKKSELKSDLGFWQLLLMAVSGTLGAGLFVLIGKGAAMAGYLLPFSFFIAGIIAILISKIYAELATSMPAAGGGQVYLRTAFKPNPLLFIIRWLTWLALIAYASMNALGLGSYLSLIIPLNPVVLSLIAIFLVVLISLKGVKETGKIEIFLGSALLLSLIGILVLTLFNFPEATTIHWEKFTSVSNPLGWIMAIPLVYVIFVGNEDIANIAAEIKNKEKNIPKTMFWNVLILIIITGLFSFLFLNLFPLNKLANHPHPFSLISNKLGFWGEILVLSTAIFACGSSLFFGILSSTRATFALSKAGEFPKLFSKLNNQKVPFVSIIATGIFIAFLCITGSVAYIAYIANIGFFIESISLSLALIKLRQERPHLPRPFLVKPYPLVPILAILFSIFFLLFVGTRAWLATIYFSIVGFFVYLFSHFKEEKSKLALKGIIIFLLLIALIFLLFFYRTT